MREISRRLLLVLCTVALAATACGDKAESTPTSTASTEGVTKAPKIVAAEANFNFGKVKQGTEVEHIFKLRNTGSGELVIEKAKGS